MQITIQINSKTHNRHARKSRQQCALPPATTPGRWQLFYTWLFSVTTSTDIRFSAGRTTSLPNPASTADSLSASRQWRPKMSRYLRRRLT